MAPEPTFREQVANALALLGRYANLLDDLPGDDSWFFEVTNDLDDPTVCTRLTRDLANVFADAVIESARGVKEKRTS